MEEKKIVLAVDSDKSFCNVASEIFRNAGFAVITADSFEEALVCAQWVRPSLIVVRSLELGEFGRRFARTVRACPDMKEVRFLSLGGLDPARVREFLEEFPEWRPEELRARLMLKSSAPAATG